MTETLNVGNAILLIGCLYFAYAHGWTVELALLSLLGAGTWAYHAFYKERKSLLVAELDLLKAKTEYYRRKELVQ